MSRFYLDTEFNGHGGSLISLALIEDNGCREFYEETMPSEHVIDPWVNENVLPVLKLLPVGKAHFRMLFANFITQLDNPEIICDWHADAVHFCGLLAGPDYSRSLDFACRITIDITEHNP